MTDIVINNDYSNNIDKLKMMMVNIDLITVCVLYVAVAVVA